MKKKKMQIPNKIMPNNINYEILSSLIEKSKKADQYIDTMSNVYEPIGYPKSIDVIVEDGRESIFNQEPSIQMLTSSQRRLFTLGADTVYVDGVFGRETYRKTRDDAYLAADGTPQRTLAYVVEEKK